MRRMCLFDMTIRGTWLRRARPEGSGLALGIVLLIGIAFSTPTQAQLFYDLNQIGADDFRISHMGPDGDTSYFASLPAVAYNSADNEFFAVWGGDDGVNDELEIWGQRLDNKGNPLGGEIRISHMGPDGNAGYWAMNPAIAYNSADNEYLVVWTGAETNPSEYEIWGQRVNAATGGMSGGEFRISFMGPDGTINYHADLPAVAYNSTDNLYLVVWNGDDDTSPSVLGREEVRGRKVSAAGGLLDSQLTISDLGVADSAEYDAVNPDVTFNPDVDNFLVVFSADDISLTNDEFEIWSQSISGPAGVFDILSNQRISQMGPDGNAAYDAHGPKLAYNPDDHLFLVVWYGDSNDGMLVDDEFEIFGRKVDWQQNLLDTQLRHSITGSDGDANRDAQQPAVAYDPTTNWFLVTWHGDQSADGEDEIWAQLATGGTGVATLIDNTRLSTMGPNGSNQYWAIRPAIVNNPTNGQWLVVWEANDDVPPMVAGEFEIFGQRVVYGLFRDGFESGTTANWAP